jgi:hypothetical protein
MENENRTRVVKNKDIPLLARVLGIMQDVVSIENRIEWQRERMYSITSHMNGMPSGKGVPTGLDAALAVIDGLEGTYQEKVRSYMRELRNAEKILNAIPSESMRTFVTMVYVDDLPQEFVKKELNLSRRSFERARAAIENAESMAQVVWRERFIVGKQE